MNKRNAISALGYAIVFVIILGIIMIVSAPMLVDKFKIEEVERNSSLHKQGSQKVEVYNGISDIMDEIRNVEKRLNSRMDELERNRPSADKPVSDKYVCTIEGALNADGVVVPIENIENQKFVFVCEYRK